MTTGPESMLAGVEQAVVANPKAHPTAQRGQRKRAADFTGRQTELLNEAKKEERAEQVKRMAMANAAEQAYRDAEIDFETGQPVPEVEVRSVEVTSAKATIRVNQDIDQMTWGREVTDPGEIEPVSGQYIRAPIMGPLKMYTFKEGQVYRNVPRELADHLNNLGYLSYYGV